MFSVVPVVSHVYVGLLDRWIVVGQVFVWSDPQASLTRADLDDSGLIDFKFFLEVYDAVGGGLLCR